MEASIVDLRYNMKEVLEALDRREEVKILYHGKIRGIISPASEKEQKYCCLKVQDHPFFGMTKTGSEAEEIVDKLRGSRY